MTTGTLKKIAVIYLGPADKTNFLLPALLGLKNEDNSIDLFINKHATWALKTQETLTCIYPIDTDVLIKFASVNPDKTLAGVFHEKIIPQPLHYDTVINLTHDSISTVFSTYLNGTKKIGPYLNLKNETQIHDPWSQYFAATIGKTKLNPFHLVDLYKYICEVDHEVSGMEIKPDPIDIEKIKAELDLKPGLKIGVVLSDKWPLLDLIEFIEEILLLYPDAQLFVLGDNLNNSSADRKKIKLFTESLIKKNISSQIHNLINRNNPIDILAITNELHLVVGPWCATTNMATCSGTFTICLTSFEDNFFESGPYGHGHIIIVDRNEEYKKISFPLNLLVEITRFAISENRKKVPPIEQWNVFLKTKKIPQQFNIYCSQRTTFHKQPGGERIDLIYEPIANQDSILHECLLAFYRLIWQFELNKSEDTIFQLKTSDAKVISGFISLIDTLQTLHKLSGFGIKYSDYVFDDIKRKNITLAKSDSDRLQEIDNYINKISETVHAVSPICSFYFIHQFQNISETPEDAAKLAKISYEKMQICISLILDLIQGLISKDAGLLSNELDKKNTMRMEGNL